MCIIKIATDVHHRKYCSTLYPHTWVLSNSHSWSNHLAHGYSLGKVKSNAFTLIWHHDSTLLSQNRWGDIFYVIYMNMSPVAALPSCKNSKQISKVGYVAWRTVCMLMLTPVEVWNLLNSQWLNWFALLPKYCRSPIITTYSNKFHILMCFSGGVKLLSCDTVIVTHVFTFLTD